MSHRTRIFWTQLFAFLIVYLLSNSLLIAQSEPQDLHDSSKWKKSIEQFEAEDKKNAPPENAILFVGSSSIRMWDLKTSFPELVTINRGFGGSQLADSVQFIDRIVLNYKPKAIVMYAGDNDIFADKSPERVFADFAEFVAILQKKLPDTPLHYVAIKPSIKRWNLVKKNRRTNQLISAYCDLHKDLFFIDIDTPMLSDDGTLDPKLFKDDGLHLSPAGYKIWNNATQASLAKQGGTKAELNDQP